MNKWSMLVVVLQLGVAVRSEAAPHLSAGPLTIAKPLTTIGALLAPTASLPLIPLATGEIAAPLNGGQGGTGLFIPENPLLQSLTAPLYPGSTVFGFETLGGTLSRLPGL